MTRKLGWAALAATCTTLLVLLTWTAASASPGSNTTAYDFSGSQVALAPMTGEIEIAAASTGCGFDLVAIPSPVQGAVPTFIAAGNNRIAWTGLVPGDYATTYLLDLATKTNVAISPNRAGHYYNPSVDGSWVVYQGSRAGAAYQDVYAYHVSSGTTIQVTRNTDPGDGSDVNPRIHGSRVVWEKRAAGAPWTSGIYVYDLEAGGTPQLLLSGPEYHNPDIWQNYVVCTRDEGGRSDIILYDLTTESSTSIGVTGKNNQDPRIDNGLVVWSCGDVVQGSAYPWSTYQIVTFDISTGSRASLTANDVGNLTPTVKGSYVAWKQHSPPGIVVFNLGTEKSQLLTVQGQDPEKPDLSENLLVFLAGKNLYYSRTAQEGSLLFSDVNINHPYAPAISALTSLRIIQGYCDGRFGLTDPTTRQQFAKMLLLTMAQWSPETYTPSLSEVLPSPFTDVTLANQPPGELYPYFYVVKAAATGLVTGYSDHTFRPRARVTRQQVITMTVRAGAPVLATPPDEWQGQLDYSSPAHGENIRTAEYNSLLAGIQAPLGGLSSWDTTAPATRGEVAQMLYNLLVKLLAGE